MPGDLDISRCQRGILQNDGLRPVARLQVALHRIDWYPGSGEDRFAAVHTAALNYLSSGCRVAVSQRLDLGPDLIEGKDLVVDQLIGRRIPGPGTVRVLDVDLATAGSEL